MYRDDLIRMAMAKKGITGDQLAIQAGLSRPTISAIVNGKPVTLESLKAVGDVLGFQFHELFKTEDCAEVAAT